MDKKRVPVVFAAYAPSELSGYSGLPDLAREAREVRDALEFAEQTGRCELVERQNATLDDILSVFQSPLYASRIAIFHFAGHADGYSLVVKDYARQGMKAGAKGFAKYLATQTGLRLVVLNGCATRAQADDLHAAGVVAVLTTDGEIEDQLAAVFAARFYNGLARGVSLDDAFKQAQGELDSRRYAARADGDSPQYHLSVSDERLRVRTLLPPPDDINDSNHKHATGERLKESLRKIAFHLPWISNRYCNRLKVWLKAECSWSDLRGMPASRFSLYFNEIYIPPTLEPQVISTIHNSAVPTSVQAEQSTGVAKSSFPIMTLLQRANLAEQRFVIVAPAGVGKTALLRSVAISLIESSPVLPPSGRTYIPLLIRLHEHVESFNAHRALSQVAQDTYKGSDVIPLDWFEHNLKQGNFVVMFDGLDEVGGKTEIATTVDWLNDQLKTYTGNRFLITTRPYAYADKQIEQATTLELNYFALPQIESFVTGWYTAVGAKTATEHADNRAKDLIDRIRRTEALRTLAVNPLLLTLIAIIHFEAKQPLPERRVELYKAIIDTLLGERKKGEGVPLPFPSDDMRNCLGAIAFYLAQQTSQEISDQDVQGLISHDWYRPGKAATTGEFLQFVEGTTGLIRHSRSRSAFVHSSFRDYLGALHISMRGLESELLGHLHEDEWHEIIFLYAGITGNEVQIIRRCMNPEHRTDSSLSLAQEIVQELVDGSARAGIQQELEDFERDGLRSDDPETKRLAAKTQLRRRFQYTRELTPRVSVDPQFVRSAEYRIFLEEQRPSNRYLWPDHWHERDMNTDSHPTAPAIGMRYSDALLFAGWLQQLLPAHMRRVCRYRLPSASEVQALQNADIFPVHPSVSKIWTQDARLIDCSHLAESGSGLFLYQIGQDIGYYEKVRPRSTEQIQGGGALNTGNPAHWTQAQAEAIIAIIGDPNMFYRLLVGGVTTQTTAAHKSGDEFANATLIASQLGVQLLDPDIEALYRSMKVGLETGREKKRSHYQMSENATSWTIRTPKGLNYRVGIRHLLHRYGENAKITQDLRSTLERLQAIEQIHEELNRQSAASGESKKAGRKANTLSSSIQQAQTEHQVDLPLELENEVKRMMDRLDVYSQDAYEQNFYNLCTSSDRSATSSAADEVALAFLQDDNRAPGSEFRKQIVHQLHLLRSASPDYDRSLNSSRVVSVGPIVRRVLDRQKDSLGVGQDEFSWERWAPVAWWYIRLNSIASIVSMGERSRLRAVDGEALAACLSLFIDFTYMERHWFGLLEPDYGTLLVLEHLLDTAT